MRLPESLTIVLLLALAGSVVLPAMPSPAPPGTAATDPAPVARSTRFAGPFPARIIAVIDGDTVEARVTIWPEHDIVTRVRLAGIDAAEISATCVEERELAVLARNGLAAMLEGATVRLFDVRRDKYAGRVVARLVNAEGDDIAARMLNDGLAIAYDGGRRQPWCEPMVTARR